MTFISFSFLIFFLVLALLYYLLPKKCQWVILLCGSYLFYFLASEKLPVYMLMTTAVIYGGTMWIGRIDKKLKDRIAADADLTRDGKKELKKAAERKRKAVLILSLCINFGLLAVFKYLPAASRTVQTMLFGAASVHEIRLLMPLGISFYTFQSTGYIVDVFRKKVQPERNFFKTALFVSYFAQIVQGPIGRFQELAPQLFAERSFSFERAKEGALLILWGFLKKLVVADNLAPMITAIAADSASYGGFQIFLGMCLYGVRLYADFSGYMDIAMGFSKILGIELAPNFKRPYFSTSVIEFWRRWHISLCQWFRDYVFYSLITSKRFQAIGKKLRAKNYRKAAINVPSFIATIIVWFLTGLWHEASAREICWGLMNGCIMVFSLQFKDVYAAIRSKLHISEKKFWFRVFQMARTFLIMSALNFMCEFPSVRAFGQSVVQFVKNPLPTSIAASYIFPETIDAGLFKVIGMGLGILAMFVYSVIEEKHGAIFPKLCRRHWILQTTVALALLFAVLLFDGSSSDLTAGFMYAQF
ncbi:MAG: MBOAT family protein [Clostridia bacterium]|nr:MBOAT family protein [Clostridia bacterium]